MLLVFHCVQRTKLSALTPGPLTATVFLPTEAELKSVFPLAAAQGFPSCPVLWKDEDGPSLPFLSHCWETGFEALVGAGPSGVMAPSVEVVSTEIVPAGKSIVT